MRGQQEKAFLTGGKIIILYILAISDDFKLKCLNDGLVSCKHTVFRFQDINLWTWSGVDYLWIIVKFLSVVWTLILTAPILCRGSSVSKWCNATFLQIWWRNKLIYILYDLNMNKYIFILGPQIQNTQFNGFLTSKQHFNQHKSDRRSCFVRPN